MSDAEQELAYQLHVLGWSPLREHRFDATRRWRFDFAFPLMKVACEVEGGSFIAGRHTQGPGFELDCIKYAEAAIAGWLVVRVTPKMVSDGRALGLIERALSARGGAL